MALGRGCRTYYFHGNISGEEQCNHRTVSDTPTVHEQGVPCAMHRLASVGMQWERFGCLFITTFSLWWDIYLGLHGKVNRS